MKVKWGVIGAGGIADRRTIPGMIKAKNAELVAVMEVNLELAENIRMKYNAAKAYDNVDMLLADDNIEAVYIASPVVFHKEQVMKTAKAKKHILIEKPVALNSVEADEVSKICKDEGILTAVGFMMRFHPYHQKMKEIVESGKLGTVISCRGQSACWYPDMPGNWRQHKNISGGGVLMDMGVHCIDLIQFITGSRAKKVSAFIGTKTFKYDVEDSAALMVEMDNGSYSYIDTNFNIPNEATKSRLEIYGTKGSLIAEGTIGQEEVGNLYTVYSGDNLADNEKEVVFGNMYTKEIESFSESILKGSSIEVTIDDALYIQRVVDAAYESSVTGQAVLL